MQFSAWCLARHDGAYRTLKAPGRQVPPAQQDPAVVARVTEMLTTIEREGLDAVRRYAKELDHFDGDQLELDRADIARSGDELDPALRRALELGAERTRRLRHRPPPGARRFRRRAGPWPARRLPLRTGVARRRLPARRAVPAARQRVHDRRRGQGRGRRHGARLHAAAARRRGERGGAVHRPPHRRRPRLRPRRRPGARRDGLRAARRTARRHARRCRQRLRRRGEAPAVRPGGDRPPRRPVGGRRHRRRHRRPRDRGRRPARPGRARPGLARRARHHLRGVRATR